MGWQGREVVCPPNPGVPGLVTGDPETKRRLPRSHGCLRRLGPTTAERAEPALAPRVPKASEAPAPFPWQPFRGGSGWFPAILPVAAKATPVPLLLLFPLSPSLGSHDTCGRLSPASGVQVPAPPPARPSAPGCRARCQARCWTRCPARCPARCRT